MSYELRRRLVGILVLVALGLVIIPLLFDFSRDLPLDKRSQIPPSVEPAKVVIDASLRPQLLDQSPAPKPLFDTSEGAQLQGGFAVQFGSFPDAETAENHRAQLLLDGYKVFVRSPVIAGKKTHRVLIGPLLERSEAEQLSGEIDTKYRVETLVKTL